MDVKNECNKIILRTNDFKISKDILPWMSKKAQKSQIYQRIHDRLATIRSSNNNTIDFTEFRNNKKIKERQGLWQEKVWTVLLSLWSPLCSNLLSYIYWIYWQRATHFTYAIHRRAYWSIILTRHWKSVNALPCCVLKLFQVQAITEAEVYMMAEEWNISKTNTSRKMCRLQMHYQL